jgi:uncharacterized protein YbaR (Trm112 family)
MDKNLLDILACPICKGPLVYNKDKQELICKADRLARISSRFLSMVLDPVE